MLIRDDPYYTVIQSDSIYSAGDFFLVDADGRPFKDPRLQNILAASRREVAKTLPAVHAKHQLERSCLLA